MAHAQLTSTNATAPMDAADSTGGLAPWAIGVIAAVALLTALAALILAIALKRRARANRDDDGVAMASAREGDSVVEPSAYGTLPSAPPGPVYASTPHSEYEVGILDHTHTTDALNFQQ